MLFRLASVGTSKSGGVRNDSAPSGPSCISGASAPPVSEIVSGSPSGSWAVTVSTVPEIFSTTRAVRGDVKEGGELLDSGALNAPPASPPPSHPASSRPAAPQSSVLAGDANGTLIDG